MAQYEKDECNIGDRSSSGRKIDRHQKTRRVITFFIYLSSENRSRLFSFCTQFKSRAVEVRLDFRNLHAQ
ncbi:hypothetical protein KY290_012525 [Solanum tuberosum]|uniref:Uncharacterized protein n=1 Tax=Solanum tuberosum TaxID=4113 RepID=A0ABQ7W3M9_SOLTU|nr:hypothetical protein KY284_012456 [Solanum tuberosum]KAH0775388.1 hypothetical protein KY290_012525 [Solanum tuberosum]